MQRFHRLPLNLVYADLPPVSGKQVGSLRHLQWQLRAIRWRRDYQVYVHVRSLENDEIVMK